MNKKYFVFLLALIIALSSGCAHCRKNKPIIFQYSTINAFYSGVYDGKLTCKELKKHGDFGMGTFNGVDGELILLGKVCYQAKADGRIVIAKNNLEIPFATANYFKPAIHAVLEKPLDLKEITEYLDLLLPDKNSIFAIKLEGEFDFVQTRSIEKQKEPYTPFTEVAKNQSVSKFSGIKGTLVGYYFPEYMKELNVAGYHLHFISRDKKHGGHLLDCNILKGSIEMEQVNKIFMELNDTKNLTIK